LRSLVVKVAVAVVMLVDLVVKVEVVDMVNSLILLVVGHYNSVLDDQETVVVQEDKTHMVVVDFPMGLVVVMAVVLVKVVGPVVEEVAEAAPLFMI